MPFLPVPVKLLRPECNLRKSNVDRMYARSIVEDAHNIETLFGHEQVTFLSCDDKARIPLGISAVQKQAPIVMSLEYKVLNTVYYNHKMQIEVICIKKCSKFSFWISRSH